MHGANMKIGRNYLVLSRHLPTRSNTAVKMSLKITVLLIVHEMHRNDMTVYSLSYLLHFLE